MRDKVFRSIVALGLASALVGWSFAGPRLPTRWRVPAQAITGGLLVLVTGAPLGLTPPRLGAGLRLGSAGAVAAGIVVAATTAVRRVRLSMSAREPATSAPVWLALQIPLGTVWAEEAAFRGALATAAAAAFGPKAGRIAQAAAFGLSHIADARAHGEPVAATVLATGLAGWLFGWFADRSGGLVAPMLAHLVINETAAAAVLTIRRRAAS
ncbi:CPBP family intramembrane metalloprotease [Mycobacterium sp. SM1]|uniref:Rv0804 family intramembrane glutamic endopeptidase n=1 Tax=Mycobacterium sp. SM1 TaxID=2816243 RepID=UPI001BCDDE78|nr:CPBP family intramembrane glutamic endopeptidase [Mycobacterium sp. SM1]MBS4727573.1 CPBP family intramembrane metalloprotease [Mycobacterium sp. SM1]